MLRSELTMSPIDRSKAERVEILANEIIDLFDSRRNYREQLDELNEITGKNFDISDIDAASCSMSMSDFAVQSLMPIVVKTNVSDNELIELIEIFRNCDVTKQEWIYYERFLEINIPNPKISRIVENSDDKSAEEILMEARKYKPIQLPS